MIKLTKTVSIQGDFISLVEGTNVITITDDGAKVSVIQYREGKKDMNMSKFYDTIEKARNHWNDCVHGQWKRIQ